MLRGGKLWESVRRQTAHALASGALHPVPCERESVEQDGVEFLVRLPVKVDRGGGPRRESRPSGANPFVPYEEDLFVTDISDTHICLLNKFTAIDHHVLIVTREFEQQESLLTGRDFEALWACMAEVDALGFYNAGLIAGASQRHKHLQLVPVPLASGPERAPIEPVLRSASFEGPVGVVPGLPFVHAVARLDEPWTREPAEAARATRATYLDLLRAVGGDREPRPYNLLVTRQWMFLVPRTREAFESIGVNGLGFAGALLVRNQREMELLRRRGPMTILKEVAVAPDSAGGGPRAADAGE